MPPKVTTIKITNLKLTAGKLLSTVTTYIEAITQRDQELTAKQLNTLHSSFDKKITKLRADINKFSENIKDIDAGHGLHEQLQEIQSSLIHLNAVHKDFTEYNNNIQKQEILPTAQKAIAQAEKNLEALQKNLVSLTSCVLENEDKKELSSLDLAGLLEKLTIMQDTSNTFKSSVKPSLS